MLFCMETPKQFPKTEETTAVKRKPGRPRKHGSRGLRDSLQVGGTAALRGVDAKRAEVWKAEMRATLTYAGWDADARNELDLESACIGFMRSQKAAGYVLSHPADGTTNLAHGEVDTGTSLMRSALAAIQARKDNFHPAVEAIKSQICEPPVAPYPAIADASPAVQRAAARLGAAKAEAEAAVQRAITPPKRKWKKGWTPIGEPTRAERALTAYREANGIYEMGTRRPREPEPGSHLVSGHPGFTAARTGAKVVE